MDFKLLKNKNFSLLMCGKVVSLMGSNMQQFVLSLYVLAITGSATLFATVLAISIIPRLLLSPVAGVFGDWFHRKKTIVAMDLINGIVVGTFAIIFVINGGFTIPLIYALVIILEVTEIFFASAMDAVIPSIVKKEDLVSANSINSLIMNLGSMASSLIAAAIYSFVGMPIIMAINSISFILSAISEMFIEVPANHKKPESISLKNFKLDLIEGLKIIKSNNFILKIIVLGAIINFCISPLFSVGVIYIVRSIFKCSDFQFAMLQVILSISMISAPIICGGFFKKYKIGKLSVISFTAIFSSILVMTFIPTPIFMGLFDSTFIPYICIMIATFIVGISATIANIGLGTLFQTIVPIEAMGRVSTVFGLAMTISIPIGQLVFGGLYDTMPPYVAILIAGLIMMSAVLYFKNSLIKSDNIGETNIASPEIN